MGFPLADILSIGSKIIDRVLPDKEKAAEAKLKLLELQQSGELAQLTAETELAKGQIETNKIEAGSDDNFTRRWRPFMGWVCGAIFATNFMIVPLLAWISPLVSMPPPPRLDIGEVMPVLLCMLGMGSLRTVEKIKV